MSTETTATEAPAAPRYVRDRFPLALCSRCLGSGTYSSCPTWGTTCFKCGVKPGLPGTGQMLATKAVRDIYAEWELATRRAKEVLSGAAQVGDVIAVDPESLRPCSGFFGGRRIWVTVTTITQTAGTEDRWSGQYKNAAGELVYTGYTTYTVTARDGRSATHEEGANHVWDRKAKVDPAPYAVRAWASLKPRHRKDVTNSEEEAAQAALLAAA